MEEEERTRKFARKKSIKIIKMGKIEMRGMMNRFKVTLRLRCHNFLNFCDGLDEKRIGLRVQLISN